MRADWTTKSLLAVIAASVCLIAFAPSGSPGPALPEPGPLSQQAGTEKRVPVRLSTGPATLPLRWHVPFARLETSSSDTHCGTSILVTNPTSGLVKVEVEYFESLIGASLGYSPLSIGGGEVVTFWPVEQEVGTYIMVNQSPLASNFQVIVEIGDFDGRATVHADDPRIIVTAFMVCRTANGIETGQTIVGLVNLPTFAVQDTLSFYQASMPANRPSTPVALPESR